MSAVYQGHQDNGSGLQKHSIGDLYPFIIYAFGDGTWAWVNHEIKEMGFRVFRQAGAIRDVKWRKAYGVADVWPDGRRMYDTHFPQSTAPHRKR